MRWAILCAALCLAAPSNLRASFDHRSDGPDLLPDKTSFAYRARHSSGKLPEQTFKAMWFSGPDRDLPQIAVAEPIVVESVQSVRLPPSRTQLCSHAAVVAAEHDLPAPFFANLIQQESGFKSHVVSPAGAQGIAQFMPRVARAYGLENPFDPIHSLAVSARFLRELVEQFGNLGLAAAAYNAGPKRVQDWMARRGKLPTETRNYVRNITGHPAERWARVKAKMEGTTLPPHARCPGIPVIEVSIPEAAPVKVAKGKGSGKKSKVAAAEKSKTKTASKKASKADSKTASAGRGKSKVAAKSEAKKSRAKGDVKTAAKSNDKPPSASKRVKVANAGR